ncbi:hypothetical protein M8C21_001661 [Ambrosia artemisiifolia]|uniref:C3H1-type domain-containing protein n=1 Tax=Ambrosia artemisiifolia TaxID=4212 RepID=A0AAD5G8P5_AMBAR|nr:hypothetical protein M8C21_001661 [Ambrosia artemisiifolia]
MVKLFLSDESPSQVGLGGQDHLQAKDSWSWHSGGSSSDNNLPPGFEGIQPANIMQSKLSQVPVIQWKCPSRFILDPTWQVAAGEESKEVEVESQREMRVLEAIYPRPSAVPPNPATMGSNESYYNDQHTPVIPVTPIEDEDMAPDTSSSSIAPLTTTNGMPTSGMVPGVEPDVITAAYSALNAAIQQISQPPPVPTTLPPTMSLPDPPIPVHTRPTHLPFSTPSSSGTHYPPPSRVGPIPVHVPVSVPVHVSAPAPAPVSVSVSNLQPPPPPLPEVSQPAKKDLNYYKSLIQQHGGEKAEAANNNNNNNHKTRDNKHKIMKPCMYYNSARGCRNGANCVFQHDSSSSQRVNNMQETQSAKRMKMDREITGT